MDVSGKNNGLITAVLFDFGGVLAEEGFREGMTAIAQKNKVHVDSFLKYVFQAIYDIGFTLGKADETVFWNMLRHKYQISGTDEELSEELLSRFLPRPYMFDLVSKLSYKGISVSILSDQTTWLDELNVRFQFFQLFDHVFNSFYMGITKKDPFIFDFVSNRLHMNVKNILFIDDYVHHIRRAQSKGLQTIQFTNKEEFFVRFNHFFPDLI